VGVAKRPRELISPIIPIRPISQLSAIAVYLRCARCQRRCCRRRCCRAVGGLELLQRHATHLSLRAPLGRCPLPLQPPLQPPTCCMRGVGGVTSGRKIAN
jgi:hypothetical protein